MKPLVWVGRFRGYGGFARATRLYFTTIQDYVEEVIAAPLEVLETGDPLEPFVKEDFPEESFELVNHLPVTDPVADGYLSVIEFDWVYPQWIKPLEQAKLILTQSSFCRDIFSEVVRDPSKIKIVPYILGEEFKPEGEILRYCPPETCAFGSVFEWVPRKMPELLIQAFSEEFNREKDVHLFLRASNVPQGAFERCIQTTSGNRQITLLETPVPDLAAFYRGLDAYISCTAGEGWGQTLSEAMACGIPTIASRHSGNLDFMNDRNSYLVEVNDWSLATGEPGLKWKIPKIESVRENMREVYEIWQHGRKSPRVQRALSIREQLSAEKVGPILFKALREYLE